MFAIRVGARRLADAGFRFQPVDAGEVAARLVDLALGTPAGLVPEMGGPKVHSLAGMLRGYLRATGKHRMMVQVRVPGRAARAVRAGATLAPDGAVGHQTWDDFLAKWHPTQTTPADTHR